MGKTRRSKLYVPVTTVLVVALLLLSGSVPIAAEPNQESLTIEAWIPAQGDARICLSGGFCPTRDDLNLLLATRGVSIPDLEGYRKLAEGYGVSLLTIEKIGQVAHVSANNRPVLKLEVHDPAIAGMSNLDDKTKAIAHILSGGNITLVLHFDNQVGFQLPQVDPVDSTGLNQIEFGFGVDQTGLLNNVAGLKPKQLSLPAYELEPWILSWINALGIDQADLILNGNQIVFAVNSEPWVTATVDYANTTELLTSTFGQVPAKAREWAENSQVAIHFAKSDSPTLTPPTLRIRQMANLMLDDTGGMTFEGYPIPFAVPPEVLGLLAGNSTVLTLDGPNQQLRASGTRTRADLGMRGISSLAQVLAPSFDWNWVQQTLRQAEVNLQVVPSGATPAERAEYTPYDGLLSTVVAEIPIAIGSNGVALAGERLPLEQLGIDLGPTLAANIRWMKHLDWVSLGTSGFAVSIDGDPSYIFLDAAMREELVSRGLYLAETRMGLPPGAVLRYAPTVNSTIDDLNNGQVKVSLSVSDQPLQPGLIEWLISRFPKQ